MGIQFYYGYIEMTPIKNMSGYNWIGVLVARAYKLTLLAANFPIQLGVSDNFPVLNSIVYTPI